MRPLELGVWATALANIGKNVVSSQAVSAPYCDALTGICFSSWTSTSGIRLGIALPWNVKDPYDAIIQIVAPIKIGWVGFAWGGTMTYNPLTVGWPNGKAAVVSSRMAFGLNLPAAFAGAEYTLLNGTGTNATHTTVTARCRGCTGYTASDGSRLVLNGTGTSNFALVQGPNAPAQPANNASSFGVHQSIFKWTHDLNAARSPKFESWVATNILPSAPTNTTTPTPTTTSTPAPTGTSLPTCAGVPASKFSGVVAKGWNATKVLGGLTAARGIIQDSAGNFLIVESGKGISVHGVGSDGCTTFSKTLIPQNNLNHGIQLSADGTTLYASAMTVVYKWTYNVTSTSVGNSTSIITGLYNGGHPSRTLLLAPHKPNLLLVAQGSDDNWDYESIDPAVARAVVKVFDISAIPKDGYKYTTDGYLMGYGLRNEVGLVFDSNNMLWGVENSGDQLTRTIQGNMTDIHEDNPADKLNYLGDITAPNNKWYGYPTCFTVWQPSAFPGQKFAIGDQFVVAPNNTFNDTTCKEKSVPPILNFQAHSAPIDGKFDAAFNNLYVSFHGSWNRDPATGYKVSVVPFTKVDGALKPVAATNSGTGYTDIFWNADVTKCSSDSVSSVGCFRPAGLLFDKQQRLYVASDASSEGELWMLSKV
ncbi:Cellobiose dehydrogenase [Lachnellula suecica]|uniref:Cellobiose dehydrogenase n=1 Tax=Lachnellula suecica TaxID=602035 RepID=A0A8T9CF99_9HELO|nr:Cellobiose dehydrogenase [Lachnellula suecica]